MRTKQTPVVKKGKKAKKAEAPPSQATILRREKKAAIAVQQLEALDIAESLYAVRCVLPPATTVNCIRASTHRTDTLFVCNAYAF